MMTTYRNIIVDGKLLNEQMSEGRTMNQSSPIYLQLIDQLLMTSILYLQCFCIDRIQSVVM